MRQKGFAPILILIILVLVGVGAYYLGTQNSRKPVYPQFLPQPTQTSVATPSNPGSPRATETPSSAWRTYTNSVRHYKINYPPDWTLDNSKAETPIEAVEGATLVISKGDYKLTIYWPSAFGPGICIFDDQPQNPPEMAEYCRGRFVTLTNLDTRQLRRLIAPETVSGRAHWTIYTKHDSNFVTLPPTTYDAPLNYDSSRIDQMDKMLSSFKSSN